MTSTQSLATKNQAALLRALTEFANLGDEPSEWERFRRRSPEFFPGNLYSESEGTLRLNAEWAKSPIPAKRIEEEHLEVWELHKDRVREARFVAVDDGQYVRREEVRILHLRNLLRDVWRNDREADGKLSELLGLVKRIDGAVGVSADWRRGSLVFHPQNAFESACYTILEKSALAKVCGNPDCPAPYFVAGRAIQRYCSPDCLKPFQKQWKRTWWEREGKNRRASMKGKKPRRRS
jgi:hypothetical protein